MFTHLHVTSAYSLMKSTIKLDQLIMHALSHGYSAVALTDHNVMHGAVEFYQLAIAEGIKPIIGMVLGITGLIEDDEDCSLTLIAKNNAGYQALLELSTLKQLSDEPVTLKHLKPYLDDLFVIIPDLNWSVVQLINQDQGQVLASLCDSLGSAYIGITPDRPNDYYQAVNRITDSYHVKLLAIADVRTLDKADATTLTILEHIQNNQPYQADTEARSDYSFRSASDMEFFFDSVGLSQACRASEEIVDQVDWSLQLGDVQLPEFNIPEGYTKEKYLAELAQAGLAKRVPNFSQAYQDRLDNELSVITSMGFADYFLIVWDLMQFAHYNKIETGFGRGSAAASLVAYSLYITGVDPIEYNLLFERFLNKDRYTMPDIDLDFPDNKRHLILEYVYHQYGSDHVAQILTFGSFASKSSVREVLRTMGASSEEMKRWSEAIPSQPQITLTEAYESSSDLRHLVAASNENERIFEMAKVIEGLPRNYSTHAAGVVMSETPLIESVPLQEGTGDIHNTQFTMGDVEAVGLLKMDFLSLKNLTVLSDCFKFSQYEKQEGKLSKDDVPIDDDQTMALFAQGDTNGVFQFEKEGIKQVLRQIKPSSIEDIIATNALYRPGPMQQIQSFIKRKHGLEKVTYPHEDLKDILEVTYGIMVYQEQVMQVATKLAGYTLSEADQLRRTMSKKIQSEMDEGRDKFIQGAKDKGYSSEVANQVYDYIDRFANYGFNRAHSVAYSMLAYYLAYFKVHYPLSFFASVMNADWGNKTKINRYLSEIRQRKIELLPPDINQSLNYFTVSQTGLRVGLKIIKDISSPFVSNIIEERMASGDYNSLSEFCERIDDRFLTVDQIKPLIQAGAFDKLGYNRRTMVESLESIIESVTKSGGNLDLFAITKARYKKQDEYSERELIELEEATTGFYFSSHPLSRFDSVRENRQTTFVGSLAVNHQQTILGQILNIRKIQTKNNQPMAFATLADETGEVNLVIFPNVYSQVLKYLIEGNVVLVKGKIEQKDREMQVIVKTLEDVSQEKVNQYNLYLKFDDLSQQNEQFEAVQQILSKEDGHIRVFVYDARTEKIKVLRPQYNYNGKDQSLADLKKILGENNCVLQQAKN